MLNRMFGKDYGNSVYWLEKLRRNGTREGEITRFWERRGGSGMSHASHALRACGLTLFWHWSVVVATCFFHLQDGWDRWDKWTNAGMQWKRTTVDRRQPSTNSSHQTMQGSIRKLGFEQANVVLELILGFDPRRCAPWLTENSNYPIKTRSLDWPKSKFPPRIFGKTFTKPCNYKFHSIQRYIVVPSLTIRRMLALLFFNTCHGWGLHFRSRWRIQTLADGRPNQKVVPPPRSALSHFSHKSDGKYFKSKTLGKSKGPRFFCIKGNLGTLQLLLFWSHRVHETWIQWKQHFLVWYKETIFALILHSWISQICKYRTFHWSDSYPFHCVWATWIICSK